MHSSIFEIRTENFSHDDWAGESTISDEDYRVEGADYFGELEDADERVEEILNFFLRSFPGKSFKIVKNEPEKTAVVEFIGDIDALHEKWYECVKAAFGGLDKKMGTMDVFCVRLACKEPFGLSTKFYLPEWYPVTESAETFMEWLRYLSKQNDGKHFKLYIGQVFDYHF